MQRDGQTKLALCGCGKLHFTYGSVTVHFEREDFLRQTGFKGVDAASGSGLRHRICH